MDSNDVDNKLFELACAIKAKKELVINMVRNDNFDNIHDAVDNVIALVCEYNELKTQVQSQKITETDVINLRTVTPARKSVQNMLEEEVAKTAKFEKLLGDKLGEKSAYEMRRSDNSWKNSTDLTVPVIKIDKRDVSHIDLDRKKNILRRGDFVNFDTGITVNFGTIGIQDTLNHSIFDSKRGISVDGRLSALYQAKELIENSICFDSIVSETGKKKSPNTLFMHKFYNICEYDNGTYLAILSVEEMGALDNDNTVKETMSRLYNLKDIKITPVDLHRGFSAPGMPQVSGRAEPTGVTKISISQLYDIVKSSDQNYFENESAVGRADREAEIKLESDYLDALRRINSSESGSGYIGIKDKGARDACLKSIADKYQSSSKTILPSPSISPDINNVVGSQCSSDVVDKNNNSVISENITFEQVETNAINYVNDNMSSEQISDSDIQADTVNSTDTNACKAVNNVKKSVYVDNSISTDFIVNDDTEEYT